MLDYSTKTDNERINLIRNDDDWRFIASKNLETITKLAKSNIDVNKFDFTNEEAVLKLLGKTKNEYLREMQQIKVSAERLIGKFNFLQSQNSECISCKFTVDDALLTTKKTISRLQENDDSFTQLQTLLETTDYVDPIDEDGGGENACCGLKFYACCTFCAASIEVFPVYLMCCALCFDNYCCKS